MDAIRNFFNSLLQLIPDIVYAAILLVVAFIVAKLVKNLVLKLLKLVKAEKLLGKLGVKDEAADNAALFIARLVSFLVFLLFVPGILDNLGMSAASNPISNMMNTFVGFIPNLVAAGLILALGIYVARIIRDLLKTVLKACKVDAVQEKLGIKANENVTFSAIIANVVFGLIVLVVLAAALDVLAIDTISAPVNAIVASIFAIIPNILGAIVLIAVGLFIAKLVYGLLKGVLESVGADNLLEKITGNADKKLPLAKICANVVRYLIIIVFVVQALETLGLPVLVSIGAAIISFLPEILSVLIIGVAGFGLAYVVDKVMAKKNGCKTCVVIAKVLIYVVTVFLVLNQLAIAPEIVNTSFILIITALCFAFAVAFGFGGKQFAANTLKKVEDRMSGCKCDCDKDCCCEEEKECCCCKKDEE